MRLASRDSGSDCSQMRPGPVSVAKNSPFAREQRAFELAHVLDVEVDGRLERHHAAGVHAQPLAGREIARHQRAAGMHEGHAITIQLLHDESFAAEQADAQALLERDAQ